MVVEVRRVIEGGLLARMDSGFRRNDGSKVCVGVKELRVVPAKAGTHGGSGMTGYRRPVVGEDGFRLLPG